MKKLILLLLATLAIQSAQSQNTYRAYIFDEETKDPLIGATAVISGTTIGSVANIDGLIEINGIPNGKQIIEYSFVGYEEKFDTLNFPEDQSEIPKIYLRFELGELETIVVSTTRSSRTIDDIPTRVETISGSELDEKVSMQPANVKMMLTESTGIQTQQTSATSGNASIRIQGLDGRYTQLLKDGFPLYSGFSGGLSIVQIPPLDLQRVEVVKGASSTLYGGGAIAGLINFITKVPTEKKEFSFLLNTNHTKALDVSSFYSQKFNKIGVTLFASQNSQLAYDANGDGFSDIPKFTRYNFNPRMFLYPNKSITLSLGVNSSFENRLGGDMSAIRTQPDSLHPYFERNITGRISTQLKFEKKFDNKAVIIFKNSIGYFDRGITKNNYTFSGFQWSSFSELNYSLVREKLEWVVGGNLWTDYFTQSNSSNEPFDYQLIVGGLFVQGNFELGKKIILEAGIREDLNNSKQFFTLPRIALIYKANKNWTGRLGGGMGYKNPTIFTEQSEERAFQNINPINTSVVLPERSLGGSFDLNYKTILFNKVSFTMNQMFFYTRLNQALVLSDSMLNNGNYEFVNANGHLDSRGFETNFKLKYKDFALYCGYTFVDASRLFNGTETVNPLTAKNRLNMTLMYEIEDKLRIGYELFYTDSQILSTGESRPDYWMMGISAEYRFKHISLFINAENFTDTRQTKYEGIYNGSIQSPQFKEIWSPIDGFILNGGIKIIVW